MQKFLPSISIQVIPFQRRKITLDPSVRPSVRRTIRSSVRETRSGERTRGVGPALPPRFLFAAPKAAGLNYTGMDRSFCWIRVCARVSPLRIREYVRSSLNFSRGGSCARLESKRAPIRRESIRFYTGSNSRTGGGKRGETICYPSLILCSAVCYLYRGSEKTTSFRILLSAPLTLATYLQVFRFRSSRFPLPSSRDLISNVDAKEGDSIRHVQVSLSRFLIS